MKKETLEEAAENNKKIEDYYLGKTLKLKKRIPSKYYQTSLLESETIKIDKFVDGEVEGCRVAVGYKNGFEFLLFNTTHAESYLQVCFELIDESLIAQEEPKQEILEDGDKRVEELLKAAENVFTNSSENYKARRGFIEGANWQAERMYSEEDMIEFAKWVFLEVGSNTGKDRTNKELFNEWFEQFKKK